MLQTTCSEFSFVIFECLLLKHSQNPVISLYRVQVVSASEAINKWCWQSWQWGNVSAHTVLTVSDRAKCRRPVVSPLSTQTCQDHLKANSGCRRDALSAAQMLHFFFSHRRNSVKLQSQKGSNKLTVCLLQSGSGEWKERHKNRERLVFFKTNFQFPFIHFFPSPSWVAGRRRGDSGQVASPSPGHIDSALHTLTHTWGQFRATS